MISDKDQNFVSNGLAQRVETVLADWGALTSPDAARWQALLRRQSIQTWNWQLKSWLRRLMLDGSYRNQSRILLEYEAQWKKKKWEKYQPLPIRDGVSPWVWGDRRQLLSNEAGAAVRLLYLEEAIARLRPKSVLEVGSGNGINLLLLSARYPGVSFCGLEPTRHGVTAATGVIRDGFLPDALRRFSPVPVIDEEAISRVRIVEGTAARLPFADNAFDLVLTSLALEQMEAIRDVALQEVARVTNSHVVMLEPFREVNANGMRRRYVKAFNYFQGRISDLEQYGLRPLSTVTNMPHKAWLGTALVVAQKKPA
jgi:SAM-dependent methyltransferase